jgi:DNA-binding GntR family transcriptional regulator
MEQHVEIARALGARDEERAEALLREHICEFQNEIKAVL